MGDDENRLGAFLRARRELITPDEAGIPVVGVRRVAGLRREEVAMLAGISADYYLRLEQGRDRHPSPQVLDALARVLRLDADAARHLNEIGMPRPRAVRTRRRAEVVPAHTLRFVGQVPFPAFVEGRCLDVLAANPLAAALSPRLTVGGNRLRDFFLDDAERDLFPHWDEAAAGLVAGFRQSIGADTDDPRVIALVGELSLASPVFGRLWARHDVRMRQGATVTFAHPSVGALTVDREKLAIPGTDGMMLVIYHAEPGTADADKLALLAASAAPAR
ncbi:MAG: XRE family transcriptional regulator [Microbacterium sp.]|jgi:transcriptional regulator with XRE-family HTH domain|uniref:Helix-turn-helix protein n=1 Tax=Microbacterium ginsengisoli TaxID=400772 RepID=A0A0F0LSI6_9MICO|nr:MULTISPECIES: helix-turn-helix transcriptional regulator [Microbacterium]MAL06326.1 XRE family transcriptional regulator [Microbacterium sp.]KJL36182.1 helix-turn-helix protein [Microbacterium ginsengisoli]KQR94028.1 XRE family transcriptional regulator [Microbacterium sp. Leaf347]MBN9198328.1 helix-turn-helix domain-containing protein [Microbacterium ginsengisoli]MBN9208193.1 helix-turn-helix domain-containing protein [Microbacterium ginsengisoli]